MALNDDIRQLTEIEMFGQLDRDALRLLAFSAETKLLRAGDVLFREGEPSDCAFFVTSGALELHTARGAPFRVAAPALLGELALVTETARPATATATAPSTVRRITRALFHRVLEESPGGAAKIRAMIVARIEDYAADLARYAQGGSG